MKNRAFVYAKKTAAMMALAGLYSGANMMASAAITFAGSSSFGGTGISANATFDTDGHGDLLITLANTFAGDVPDQSHVLTALFFSGANGLTAVQNSAVAPSGSKEWNIGTQIVPVESGSTLGQQWEYLSGSAVSSQAPGGATAGISSTGLGIFGSGNFAANGANLDGSAYGILSKGYNGSTGDGLKTHGPYIQNSMTFELSGFSGNLNGISDVIFQYGTTLGSEPSFMGNFVSSVPEPNYGIASAASLLVGFGVLRARRVQRLSILGS